MQYSGWHRRANGLPRLGAECDTLASRCVRIWIQTHGEVNETVFALWHEDDECLPWVHSIAWGWRDALTLGEVDFIQGGTLRP